MTDNKELMIADYYESKIIPETPQDKKLEEKLENFSIKHSTTATVKVGGSYKTFSVDLKNKCAYDPNLISWKIVGLSENDFTTLLSPETPDVIKIKVSKDYSLIGKTFTLELYYDGTLACTKEIEVIGL